MKTDSFLDKAPTLTRTRLRHTCPSTTSTRWRTVCAGPPAGATPAPTCSTYSGRWTSTWVVAITAILLTSPLLVCLWYWRHLSWYFYDIDVTSPGMFMILMSPLLVCLWYWCHLSWFVYDIDVTSLGMFMILMSPLLVCLWYWRHLS